MYVSQLCEKALGNVAALIVQFLHVKLERRRMIFMSNFNYTYDIIMYTTLVNLTMLDHGYATKGSTETYRLPLGKWGLAD